jgi:hypothetical protein
MSEQIKPCRFCGNMPRCDRWELEAGYLENIVWCETDGCEAKGDEMALSVWNEKQEAK